MKKVKKTTKKYKTYVIENIQGLVNIRRIELILIDIAIITLSYFLISWLSSMEINSLRFNGQFTGIKYIMLAVCIIGVRFICCIYNSIWRYANVGSYLKLMVSDTVGGCIFFVIGRFNNNLSMGFAYSIVSVMMIFILTLASRFMYQYLYAKANQHSDTKLLKGLFGDKGKIIHKINVAIVGAGNVGANLAEEFLRNPTAHYMPYCFIDKDIKKIGSGINGIRIYPEDEHIVDRIKSMPVQEIVIAIPDASAEDKARLYELYKQTDCKVKLYDYPLSDKKTQKNAKRSLREFSIEDLLFRDTIKVNNTRTRSYYTGKTILVTGGGGSIGSELCRQIAALEPKQLVILDIYENNAYDIQQELIRHYGLYDESTGEGLNLRTIIASVRDEKRLDEIFAEIRPDIVFHAAAHKHVPLMENNGCEAIKNNIFGTYNVANMAEKYGVKKFLLISTDKAVNPTNIMGASKRMCEMIIQCRADGKSNTEFTAVRFGNVLGSNGSVIPLFRRQIEAGGPVTITDKRIIRYFMTIPEAVGLVMEAAAMAHNGELFVLDMGKPVRIIDLAENMIKFSGLKPYEDIDIVEIGLRPGEKLYEELLMKTEELDKTDNELIFIERDKGLPREQIEDKLRILRGALDTAIASDKAAEADFIRRGHHDAVIDAIRATVPTYHDPDEVNRRAQYSTEMSNINTSAAISANEAAAAVEENNQC